MTDMDFDLIKARLHAGSRLNPETGCIEWVRAKDTNGYGVMSVMNRQRNTHRISYEVHKGPIPSGMEVDHLCRVRCCLNPAHLEAVTKQENMRRSQAITALNAPKTHCHNGHPLEGDNLLTFEGYRRCKLCRIDRDYAKARAAGKPTRARRVNRGLLLGTG